MEHDAAELEPVLQRFPTHHELAEALRGGANETMARLRRERGAVHRQEDIYATGRWMMATVERLEDYGRAFASAAATIKAYAEEELLEAVGEQDGIPTQNLTIPSADGDVQLTRKIQNEHDIDTDDVFTALAFAILEEYRGTEPAQGGQESDAEYVATYEEWMAEMLVTAMRRSTGLVNYKPLVTKVRELATDLARAGQDSVAATVRDAIRTKKKLTGVDLSRKKPR
jgi:hypothetical protein